MEKPSIAVDIIIEYEEGIVIIERHKEPLGFAIPGGFVDYGETVEQAAIREAKEETNLDIEILKQFHTYSDPKRDPRGHTISVVFIAKASGELKAGDDAKEAHIFKLEAIPSLCFDHNQIIDDYIHKRY